MRRRRAQRWCADLQARLRFERDARREHPDLRVVQRGRGRDASLIYTMLVDVPEYEARTIEVRLWAGGDEPVLALVTADGPIDSPHRYTERRLCLWRHDDDEPFPWSPADGLLSLVLVIRRHLFQEAYFRERFEWAGPEFPHVRYPLRAGGAA